MQPDKPTLICLDNVSGSVASPNTRGFGSKRQNILTIRIITELQNGNRTVQNRCFLIGLAIAVVAVVILQLTGAIHFITR